MGKPKFIVIGAAKAGTSSLRHYLRQHPDIFIPGGWKEPGFFCYGPDGDSIYRLVRTEAEYYGLFDGVRDEKIWGEITPHYLNSLYAAGHIHAAVPEAQLIVSLRNPADRAFSLYQMNLRNKDHNKGVPFLEAIRNDPIMRRTYSDALGRFYELFDAGQILTLLFDDLTADPVGTSQSIFAFLGVDAAFAPDASKVVNPGGLPRSRLLHLALSNRTARRIGGMFIPMRVQNRLEAIKNANLVPQRLTAEERAEAAAIFREDILRTEDLIGLDLSRWLAPGS